MEMERTEGVWLIVVITNLHLSIGPAGHLNDHVEDSLLLVGIERNIVEC